MTFSAYRLVRAAHEVGAATAIVNVGVTRADDIVPLKINARLGEQPNTTEKCWSWQYIKDLHKQVTHLFFLAVNFFILLPRYVVAIGFFITIFMGKRRWA